MQIFFNFHISSSIYHNHVIGTDNLFPTFAEREVGVERGGFDF